MGGNVSSWDDCISADRLTGDRLEGLHSIKHLHIARPNVELLQIAINWISYFHRALSTSFKLELRPKLLTFFCPFVPWSFLESSGNYEPTHKCKKYNFVKQPIPQQSTHSPFCSSYLFQVASQIWELCDRTITRWFCIREPSHFRKMALAVCVLN